MEQTPKESFRALINNHSRQVLNTAMRILGDSQKAQDVHQEVFLAIWRRWHKYDGQTNWNAYLYRTTVRKAIEYAKRLRTNMTSQQQQNYVSEQPPDSRLRAAELQKKLRKCLAGLPQRQTDAFVLSRIEGLRFSEVAVVMGCSEGTVRVHLHRAMKRLAAELSDYLA